MRISEMMQKLLEENILSLVECRTWQSLPGNQLQSRQAWRHRPGGLGHRAALSCPEGGGGGGVGGGRVVCPGGAVMFHVTPL